MCRRHVKSDVNLVSWMYLKFQSFFILHALFYINIIIYYIILNREFIQKGHLNAVNSLISTDVAAESGECVKLKIKSGESGKHEEEGNNMSISLFHYTN